MENTSEFFEKCYELQDIALELGNRYCDYNIPNAWRTCEVLRTGIIMAIDIVDLFVYEEHQHNYYLSAVDGITFDDLKEENEYEKMNFEANKKHKECIKATLRHLESVKGVKDLHCDNQYEVQKLCNEFVQLIDEVIEYLDLAEE